LFLLILVLPHTGVLCLVLLLFPCICQSATGHTLHHVFLRIVLLSVLVMPIYCGTLSHQIVDTVCTCYLFLFTIILLHDTLFVMPSLVLLLYHFQFLLSSPPLDSLRNLPSLPTSAVSLGVEFQTFRRTVMLDPGDKVCCCEVASTNSFKAKLSKKIQRIITWRCDRFHRDTVRDVFMLSGHYTIWWWVSVPTFRDLVSFHNDTEVRRKDQADCA
jgi:hypothetical protein